jgi:hypothetical protein
MRNSQDVKDIAFVNFDLKCKVVVIKITPHSIDILGPFVENSHLVY